MKPMTPMPQYTVDARSFAKGDTDALHLTQTHQLVAWRVDGDVYMMLGGDEPNFASIVLNRMIVQSKGGVPDQLFMHRGGAYTYKGRPVGADEVIKLEIP